MEKSDHQITGIYQPGETPLHRLDSRLKLILLLLLIISLFAGPGPWRLLLLLTIAGGGMLITRVSAGQLFQKMSSLRWLLLFGLLLHLFFTPGRTLFGTSWLSYDGLLRGLEVDLQLLLALSFSYLLALTTSPAALSRGLTRLLTPLKRVGVPVEESGGLLILVLHFIPLVREEASTLARQDQSGGLAARLRAVISLIGPLLVSLVNQADRLAHEVITRGTSFSGDPVEQNRRFTLLDRWLMVCCCPLFALLWIL